MNRKTVVVIAVAVGLILVATVIWLAYRNTQFGTLDITITPSDAIITIDGQQKETQGSLKLEPGSRTLEITRNGFQTQTLTLEIQKGQTITRDIRLSAINSAEFAKWQAEHPQEAREAEARAGKEVVEMGAKITADNPILNRLPYVTSTFRIDFGASEEHPDDLEAIALYITADDETGKANAQKWMRSQGFDPEKFEIIYRGSGSNETGE